MDPNLDRDMSPETDTDTDASLIDPDTRSLDTLSPDTMDIDHADPNAIDPRLIDPRILDPSIAEANKIARTILTTEDMEQWTTAQLELQSMQPGQEYFTYPNIQELLRKWFWETEVELDDTLRQQVECYPWPRALLIGDENFHKHEGGIDGCPDSKTLVFMNFPLGTHVLHFLKDKLGVNHTEVVGFRFRFIMFHDQIIQHSVIVDFREKQTAIRAYRACYLRLISVSHLPRPWRGQPGILFSPVTNEFYSEYALPPNIPAVNSQGFVAKVTAHFYVPPTKVGLRSLDACMECYAPINKDYFACSRCGVVMGKPRGYEVKSFRIRPNAGPNDMKPCQQVDTTAEMLAEIERNRRCEMAITAKKMKRKEAYRAAFFAAKRALRTSIVGDVGDAGKSMERFEQLRQQLKAIEKDEKRKMKEETQAEREAASEAASQASRAFQPKTALEKFKREAYDRDLEQRVSALPLRSPTPPRFGPPYDPEKVFDVAPPFEKVFKSCTKYNLLLMSEIPVKDKSYLQRIITHYRTNGRDRGCKGLLRPVPAINVRRKTPLPPKAPERRMALLRRMKPSKLFKMTRPPSETEND